MKKINLLAIMGVALLLVVLAGMLIFVRRDNSNAEENKILQFVNKSEVKEYIKSNDIEKYSFDTSGCYLGDVRVLGDDAQVEFYFNENDDTKQIVAYYMVFQYANGDATESEIESTEDIWIYDFTNEDKKEIEESFNDIKAAFEEYIGCELVKYDLIPTYENASTEDNDENFYQGNVIREYSVRDNAGVLWLLRYEASYGSATTTLIKIVDDAEYEGFIPIVDMYNK